MWDMPRFFWYRYKIAGILFSKQYSVFCLGFYWNVQAALSCKKKMWISFKFLRSGEKKNVFLRIIDQKKHLGKIFLKRRNGHVSVDFGATGQTDFMGERAVVFFLKLPFYGTCRFVLDCFHGGEGFMSFKDFDPASPTGAGQTSVGEIKPVVVDSVVDGFFRTNLERLFGSIHNDWHLGHIPFVLTFIC